MRKSIYTAVILFLLPLVVISQTRIPSMTASLVRRDLIEWGSLIETNKQINLVILAGQSNALGFPNDGDYYTNSMPSYLKANQSDVRTWNYTPAYGVDRWSDEPLRPGSWEMWGLELQMMHDIQQVHEGDVALIKVAYGSTSFWNNWLKDAVPSPGAQMYDRAVEIINECFGDLEGEGFTVNPLMFVWVQGEHDTVTNAPQPSTSLAYFDNYTNFWADLCADTGLPTDMQTILSPLSPLYVGQQGGLSEPAYVLNVKQAQTNLATTYSHIDLLDVSDAEWYSGVHYSGAYLNTMGSRCASNYLSRFDAVHKFGQPLTNGTFARDE